MVMIILNMTTIITVIIVNPIFIIDTNHVSGSSNSIITIFVIMKDIDDNSIIITFRDGSGIKIAVVSVLPNGSSANKTSSTAHVP